MSRKIFLGIDLGHNSVVTASSSTEEPFQVTVDANGLSNRSTPSMIGLESNRVIFGEEAETRISSVPHRMVNAFPSRLEDDSIGPFHVGTEEELHLSPSQLVSLFFKNYLNQVHPDTHLQFTTVSVPVGFTEKQVQVVTDAAAMAGITEFDVIDHVDAAMTLLCKDPQVAASKEAIVMVDVGFSQTGVGLMKNGCLVGKRSIGYGVSNLIEIVCDALLVKSVGFLKKIKSDDPKSYFRLAKVSEKVLKDLSMLPSTVVDLGDYDEALERNGAKQPLSSITVHRDQFEQALLTNGGFVQELKVALADFGLFTSGSSVRVEVVGGGTRVPIVARKIAETCGVESVGRGLDGSAFAALGAALWSAGKRDLGPGVSRVKPDHVSPERRSSLVELESVQETIEKLHQLEVQKLKRKNDLESYLYQIRYWLDDSENGSLLDRHVIEPECEAVWSWFYSVDDGETLVSADGIEFEDKLNAIQSFMNQKGSALFAKLEQDKDKVEKSLSSNAEYLSSHSSHESAAEKRAKHQDNQPTSIEQQIKLAGKNKDEGNELFKHGTITDAMNRYMRAINILAKINKGSLSEEDKKTVNTICLSSNLNMAQCVVRLTVPSSDNGALSQDERDGLLKRGSACADAALAIDPSNPKAKYRKAVCLDRLRETEQAKKVIDEALKTNPEDDDLKQLYDSLVASLKAQQSKAKKFFTKMFQ